MKKKKTKTKRKVAKPTAHSPYSNDYDWRMTIPTGKSDGFSDYKALLLAITILIIAIAFI